jgi:hypothetical protein
MKMEKKAVKKHEMNHQTKKKQKSAIKIKCYQTKP